MSTNMGTAEGRIVVNGDPAKEGFNIAEQAYESLMNTIQTRISGLRELSNNLLKVGVTGSVSLAGVITVAANFEERLSAIAAVSGATASEMDLVSEAALRIGADTSFSASQAASAMEELVKAGISLPDVLNGAADATVALAAAGEIALPRAAEIAANAMNNFNMSGKEMPKIADLIAGAANASAISVEEFGSSLSQSGAVAAITGMSFDDLAVAIAEMGNAGIKGSDAGTSLKTMMMNLIPTTDRQKAKFEELGLMTYKAEGAMKTLSQYGIKPMSSSYSDVTKAISEYLVETQGIKDGSAEMTREVEKFLVANGMQQNAFFDSSGKIKSLADIQQILANTTKTMTEEQKLSTLEILFGADAIRAAAVMSKEGAAGYNEMATAMGKVTAADVAAKRLDNLMGSIEELKGSLETAAITVGTTLIPMARMIVEAFTTVVNMFNQMPGPVKAFWASILTGIFIGRVMTGVLLKMLLVLPILLKWFAAKTLLSPFFSILGSGAATIARTGSAMSGMVVIMTRLRAVGGPLGGVIRTLMNVIGGMFNIFRGGIGAFGAFFAVLRSGGGVLAAFRAGAAAIGTALGPLRGIIMGVLNPIRSIIAALPILRPLAAVAFGPWGLVISGVVAAFMYAYNHMENFRNNVNGVLNTVRDAFLRAVAPIVEFGRQAGDAIRGGMEAVQRLLGDAQTAIDLFVRTLMGEKTGTVPGWAQPVIDAANSVKDGLRVAEATVRSFFDILMGNAGAAQGENFLTKMFGPEVAGQIVTVLTTIHKEAVEAGKKIMAAFEDVSKMFNEVATVVGPILMQVFDELVKAGAELGKAFADLGAALLPVLVELGEALIPIGQAVLVVAGIVLGALFFVLYKVAMFIISVLLPAFIRFAGFIISVLAAAIGFIVGVIGGLIAIFAKVVAAVIEFFVNIEKHSATARDAIHAAWSGLVTAIVGFFSMLGAFFAGIWNGIVTTVTGAMAAIGMAIQIAINAILAFIGGFIANFMAQWNAFWGTQLGQTLSAFGNMMLKLLSFIWQSIVWSVTGAMTTIGAAFSMAWNAIVATVTVIWNRLVTGATVIFNSIATVIVAVWSRIVASTSAAWNAVVALVMLVWSRISSAVSVAINGVMAVVSAIWNRITSVTSATWNAVVATILAIWNRIKTLVSGAVNGVLMSITGGFGSAKRETDSAWSGIVNSIRDKINQFMALVNNIDDRIRSALSGAGTWLYNIGRDIIQGLINGVNNSLAQLEGVFNNITNMIPDWKGPAEKDAKLLTKNGRLILRSLIGGLADEVPALERFLQNMTTDIPTTVTTNANAMRATGANLAGGLGGTPPMILPSPQTSSESRVEVHQNIYNPVAEKTSETTVKEVSRLAALGVFA